MQSTDIEEKTKIVFKDYYASLSPSAKRLAEFKLRKAFRISQKTFYERMRKNAYTPSDIDFLNKEYKNNFLLSEGDE